MGLDRLNPKTIIVDHRRTYRRFGSTEIRPGDVLFFEALPVLIGVMMTWYSPTISRELASAILSALSVLGGLLLNLQILIINTIDRVAERVNAENVGSDGYSLRLTLLKETNSHISYAILVALLILTLALAIFIPAPTPWMALVGTGIMYSLLSHFLLVLALILFRTTTSLSAQQRQVDTYINEQREKAKEIAKQKHPACETKPE